jgi:hypothetical protein
VRRKEFAADVTAPAEVPAAKMPATMVAAAAGMMTAVAVTTAMAVTSAVATAMTTAAFRKGVSSGRQHGYENKDG